MPRKSYTVTGMSCGGCEENVSEALMDIGGISAVEADHETDAVEVEADDQTADGDIRAAIEDAGFDVVEG